MEIEVFCIAPNEELFSQIRENCAATRRWAKAIPAHDGAAVLVGGGPSLRKNLDGVRMRQEHGQKVFALNGACKFLNDNGITPDYQVLLDPQPLLIDYIGDAKEHLVASQCHPSILKALPNATLWHLDVEGAKEQIPPFDDDYCLVGGGITVGLSAMCVAYSMGYRAIHCYGYDSSYADDGQDHAYAAPADVGSKVVHKRLDHNTIVVTYAGKKFNTSLCLFQQAQTFQKTAGDLIELGCLITVNCDGLLRSIVDENNRLTAAEAA